MEIKRRSRAASFGRSRPLYVPTQRSARHEYRDKDHDEGGDEHQVPQRRDRGEPRTVHQKRREKHNKNELRIDRYPMQTRREGNGASADDQRRGGRQREAPGQLMQAQHHQEHGDDQFKVR